MTLKTYAWIVAVIFLALGILGFVPGIVTEDGLLLGLFQVDLHHNLVHIISGIVAALAAMVSDKASRLFFQVAGVVYAVVTILGFFTGEALAVLVPVNVWDNLLHLVLAVIFLALGFGKFGKKDEMMASPSMPADNTPPSNPGMNM